MQRQCRSAETKGLAGGSETLIRVMRNTGVDALTRSGRWPVWSCEPIAGTEMDASRMAAADPNWRQTELNR